MGSIFRAGQVTVDLDGAYVRGPDGVAGLSATEVALLRHLWDAPGPVSRQELLTEVWGYAPTSRTRTVDTTLSRVRKKLEGGGPPRHLVTRRGIGVELVGVVAAEADIPPARQVELQGRETELRELGALLERQRWISVVGVSGIGKTDLVRVACAQRATLWVEMGSIDTPQDLLDAICTLLSTRGSSFQTVLGASPITLVLDGAHAAIAALVDDLLAVAGVTVVATAQGPLDHPREHVLALRPLSPSDTAALLARHLERLGYARPNGLRALADELDGLPLECELLAPLIGLLGTDALGLRLDAEREGGPTRHRSLRAALTRSIETLPGPVLTRARAWAHFTGWFDLVGASKSAGVGLLDAGAALNTLYRRSLVVREGKRFKLLESLRLTLREGSPPPELDAFLLTLEERQRREGIDTVDLYRRDLLEAVERFDDPDDRVRILGVLIELALVVGPPRLAAAQVQRALRSLTGQHRQRVLGLSLWVRSMSEPVNPELHAIADQVDVDDPVAAMGRYMVRQSPQSFEQLIEACDACTDHVALGRVGDQVALMDPDHERGLARAMSLRRLFDAEGLGFSATSAAWAQVHAYWVRGMVGEAHALMAELDSIPGVSFLRWRVALSNGDLDAARDALDGVSEIHRAVPGTRRYWTWARSITALVWGNTAAARSLATKLEPDPADRARSAYVDAIRAVLEGTEPPPGPCGDVVRAWQRGELGSFAPVGVESRLIALAAQRLQPTSR